MNIIQSAAELFDYLESKAKEEDCFLKLVTDNTLSLANRIYTDIPLEELSRIVMQVPETKSVSGVSMSLVEGLVCVTNGKGVCQKIPVFSIDF